MIRKLLISVLCLAPLLAKPQGFQVNLLGEKQIGMGHTGTGLSLDGATVLFNPGAVATLSENYVEAGISPLLFESDFNPSGSNVQYHTASKIAEPFSIYAVWGPKAARWKLGFGVYTPFGGLADWGNSWEGKYTLESLNLKAIYFQPTLSVRLTNSLSIGAGFVYNHASVDLTQAIPVTNSNGQDGQAELIGDGKGYGWNAGIYFKTGEVSIGITHRSQVTTTINNGNAIFTVAPSLQGSFPQPNTFTSTIPLPATNSIGFGFYPSQKWILALDFNAVNWNVYKVLAFDYKLTTPELQNSSSTRDYKNAYDFRGGAQYSATKKIALRAGGGYATTAVSDGYVTPEAPDANRVYFTGGVGYKITKHLDIDASFEYEHLLPRTQTNIQSQLSGTFETNVYIPGISLSCRW